MFITNRAINQHGPYIQTKQLKIYLNINRIGYLSKI